MNNPAFPDFGDLWRDLLRQWEDAGNSLGTDVMKSPEFSKVHESGDQFFRCTATRTAYAH